MERKIKQGENGLIRCGFNDRNGNPLDLSRESIDVNIYFIQNSMVRQKYSKGSGLITILEGNVVLTFSSEFTSSLKKSTTQLLMEIIGPSDIVADARTNNQFLRKVFIISDRPSFDKSIIDMGVFKTNILLQSGGDPGTILTDQDGNVLTDQDGNILIL